MKETRVDSPSDVPLTSLSNTNATDSPAVQGAIDTVHHIQQADTVLPIQQANSLTTMTITTPLDAAADASSLPQTPSVSDLQNAPENATSQGDQEAIEVLAPGCRVESEGGNRVADLSAGSGFSSETAIAVNAGEVHYGQTPNAFEGFAEVSNWKNLQSNAFMHRHWFYEQIDGHILGVPECAVCTLTCPKTISKYEYNGQSPRSFVVLEFALTKSQGMQSMTLILYRAFFEKKALGVGLSSQRSSNGVEIGTLRFLWDGSEVVVTALGVISQVNGDASHGQSFPHKFMAVVVVFP